MTKKPLLFLPTLLLLIFTPLLFAQEAITITSYYPSPNGVYNSLLADKFGVGDNNGDGDLTSADIPTTAGDAWINGNVGIGMQAPSVKLEIQNEAGSSNDVLRLRDGAGNIKMLFDSAGRLRVGDFGSLAINTFDGGIDANVVTLSGMNRDMAIVSYMNGVSAKADLEFFRAQGTPASPQNVASDTQLGYVNFNGYFAGAPFFNRIARIGAAMDGAPNASSLPSRIEFYTTPTNSVIPENSGQLRMVIKNNGNVGIGTANPTLGPLQMASGAFVSAGGVWTNASSRAYKQDIAPLGLDKAIDTLSSLQPVTFRYKRAPDEQHAGFIAEDVPELVATKGRTGLSAMDIEAVLTKVVQEQQREIESLKQEVSSLEQDL